MKVDTLISNHEKSNVESDYADQGERKLRPKSSLSVNKYSQKNVEKMNLNTFDSEANSSKYGTFTCSRPSR